MAMLLGNLFEGIVAALVNIIVSLVDIWINVFITLWGGIIYTLITQCLFIIDFLQSIFRRMAGMEPIWVNGQEAKGDLVLFFITDPRIMDVFLVLTGLGVFILILATIIQMVRVEFTTLSIQNSKGKDTANNKVTIIKTAFKSFFNFAIVPVTVICGVFLAQGLLQTLDRATSIRGASKISNSVFVAGAANANKLAIKNYKTGFDMLDMEVKLESDNYIHFYLKTHYFDKKPKEFFMGFKEESSDSAPVQRFSVAQASGDKVEQRRLAADLINQCFMQNKYLALSDSVSGLNNSSFARYSGAYNFAITAGIRIQGTGGESCIAGHKNGSVRYMPTYDVLNPMLTLQFYDMHNLNYIILIAGVLISVMTMLNCVVGMMIRLFYATMYYVLVPPVVGIMPLDGGTAFNKWKQEFIGYIVGAYGTVVGFNIMFLILPLVQNLNIFTKANAAFGISLDFQNNLVNLLFVIVGLLFVKDATGVVASLIGAKDINKLGGDMNKKVGKAVAKVVSVAVTAAIAVVSGGASLAANAASLASKAAAGATKAIATRSGRQMSARTAKFVAKNSKRAETLKNNAKNSRQVFKKNAGKLAQDAGKSFGLDFHADSSYMKEANEAKHEADDLKMDRVNKENLDKAQKFKVDNKEYSDNKKRESKLRDEKVKPAEDKLAAANKDLAFARNDVEKKNANAAIKAAKRELKTAKKDFKKSNKTANKEFYKTNASENRKKNRVLAAEYKMNKAKSKVKKSFNKITKRQTRKYYKMVGAENKFYKEKERYRTEHQD